ncbi:lysophospholipase L1-like esterase [Evansella vedderi]|uniref:Lysophospholipase L1-like esterase n=1 Tax=Evansella vedderi TaxID=38282 RepID=A0ABU0A2P5_9BACI|nr:GDSL-type esterase/lipase family protein [Evansella vedderi]MDQ0257764.1 lysophospholipase L1-like esterase [Evansella vedderi]
MKTIYRSIVILLVFMLLASTNVFAKNENATKSLVALGDSIPYGYNLGNNNNASPSRVAFPYLIGEELDMRVRNLAGPGWQTGHLLTALETDQKFRQAVRHADYITLNIGNNDLLKALATAQVRSGGDPVLFQQYLMEEIGKSNIFGNLGLIISEIRSLTDAPVVIYNIYNPFQTYDPLHVVGSNLLPGINHQLSEAVGLLNSIHNNILLVDAYAAFGTNQEAYVISEDIHPTKSGQGVLADIGIRAIGSLLFNR